MSLEAWGDEFPMDPEGFVSEELYDEELQCSHEARVLLAAAHRELSSPWSTNYAKSIAKRIDEWLDQNTPKIRHGPSGETWRRALERQVRERRK